MNINNNTRKILCQGWLWKCPRVMKILTTKWSRRWFVLEVSEGRPEFIVMKQYSTKDTEYCRSIIGMNLCEELRTGSDLKYKRRNYPYTFGVKILNEWRYFAADNENDMNDWVNAINYVCGLKKSSSDKSTISLTSRFRDKFRNVFVSNNTCTISNNSLLRRSERNFCDQDDESIGSTSNIETNAGCIMCVEAGTSCTDVSSGLTVEKELTAESFSRNEFSSNSQTDMLMNDDDNISLHTAVNNLIRAESFNAQKVL